jgi:hypothetical protein
VTGNQIAQLEKAVSVPRRDNVVMQVSHLEQKENLPIRYRNGNFGLHNCSRRSMFYPIWNLMLAPSCPVMSECSQVAAPFLNPATFSHCLGQSAETVQ